MPSFVLFIQLVSLICKIEPRNALILALLNENLDIIFLPDVVQKCFQSAFEKRWHCPYEIHTRHREVKIELASK